MVTFRPLLGDVMLMTGGVLSILKETVVLAVDRSSSADVYRKAVVQCGFVHWHTCKAVMREWRFNHAPKPVGRTWGNVDDLDKRAIDRRLLSDLS